ncbi:MAG: YesL family protein [Lachnospiraceae bacterium]|nr:YesL family protein [Lachnospiraceae bacterium]
MERENDIKYNEILLEKPEKRSIGSKILGFLTELGDLVILNWLWLVTSLPIFTIGASTAALYSTFYDINSNFEGNTIKQYFKNFKDNFKQGTVAWLITVLGYLIAFCDAYFAFHGDRGTVFTIFFGFIFIFTFVAVSFTTTLVFPLIARYKNDLKHHFRNALALSGFCFYYSLLMIFVLFFPMIVTFSFVVVFKFFGWLWLLCGFAFTFYVLSFIAMKIFKRIKIYEANGE